MPDVVIVGAGPVGTLLAAELTRFGTDVVLLDRRPAAGGGTRAIGLHSPVLAALEAGGATERILADAVRVGRGEAVVGGRTRGVVRFDRLQGGRARHPYVATLPQEATERALAAGAPAPVRGVTVTAVRRDGDRVHVISDRGEWSAVVVVVAGGAWARGLVFRHAVATAYRDRYVMTDAVADGPADVAQVHLAAGGVVESFPLPGGLRRLVAWDGGEQEEPAARLAAALRERAGIEVAVDAATEFGVRRFVAPSLRHGPVFAIGDTAHEVSPIGGQGMNLGLLDAATLAPLLAAWMRTGTAPEAALARWERGRVASARRAARIAAVNTLLGRPQGRLGHAARDASLRAALAAASPALAHAYAMGFDAAARS